MVYLHYWSLVRYLPSLFQFLNLLNTWMRRTIKAKKQCFHSHDSKQSIYTAWYNTGGIITKLWGMSIDVLHRVGTTWVMTRALHFQWSWSRGVFADNQFSVIARWRTMSQVAVLKATFIKIRQPNLCRQNEFVYSLKNSLLMYYWWLSVSGYSYIRCFPSV